MLRLTAALVAMVAVSGAAEAARLVTPIFDNVNHTNAGCRLAYFGKVRHVPVRITIIGHANQPGNERRSTGAFKMGPNNRAVALNKQCDAYGGDLSCDHVRCVFEVPNNVNSTHFLGAACRVEDVRGVVPGYCAAAGGQ